MVWTVLAFHGVICHSDPELAEGEESAFALPIKCDSADHGDVPRSAGHPPPLSTPKNMDLAHSSPAIPLQNRGAQPPSAASFAHIFHDSAYSYKLLQINDLSYHRRRQKATKISPFRRQNSQPQDMGMPHLRSSPHLVCQSRPTFSPNTFQAVLFFRCARSTEVRRCCRGSASMPAEALQQRKERNP